MSVSDPGPAFSTKAFLQRAGALLLTEPPAPEADGAGDHVFDPSLAELRERADPRPAAVLIGIVERVPEATVLLTTRTENLTRHAGQVALPGGRIDPGEGPLEAALREAEEEIGLDPALVTPLGYLPAYLSTTNYRIVPVVGLVAPDPPLTPNPAEVADVFEVPLGFLMDAQNHQRHSRQWQGRLRTYFAMPFGERYIWGVTAGILRSLYETVYPEVRQAR